MVKTYLQRAHSSITKHVIKAPPRLLAFLFLLLFLFLSITGLPAYFLGVLIAANTFAIYAVSWDFLVGRTGQMSLGHALFFGVGAYGTALLFKYYKLPVWLTIPLAVLIGVFVAFLIGFPCLRVKGPYLALVTMSFPLILTSLVYYFRDVTGGEFGIRNLPRFFSFLTEYQQRLAEYNFTLLMLVISTIIMYKIANSKIGVIFITILDNEIAAQASGVNVTKYKLMALVISGFFASLAGAIQAHILTLANPPVFSLTLSFTPVIVTILGGLGTIYGPLAGAYIYYILDKYVLSVLIRIPPEWQYAKFLLFILVVLIFIIKWPRGVARFAIERLKKLQKVTHA